MKLKEYMVLFAVLAILIVGIVACGDDPITAPSGTSTCVSGTCADGSTVSILD